MINYYKELLIITINVEKKDNKPSLKQRPNMDYDKLDDCDVCEQETLNSFSKNGMKKTCFRCNNTFRLEKMEYWIVVDEDSEERQRLEVCSERDRGITEINR